MLWLVVHSGPKGLSNYRNHIVVVLFFSKNPLSYAILTIAIPQLRLGKGLHHQIYTIDSPQKDSDQLFKK